jgi:Cytochrome c3
MRTSIRIAAAIVVMAHALVFHATSLAQRLDPAAWGSDHVGKSVPEFPSGDECLFCHRDVGPTWGANRHGQTVRTADPQSEGLAALSRSLQFKTVAGEVELVLAAKNRLRFLKRSAEHGRLDLLSVEWIAPSGSNPGRLTDVADPRWDTKTFGARCAGCHATGLDSTKQTFAAVSLDCFACHGEVPEKHTMQGALVFLSPHRRDSAQVVTSTCAQCHLRTGVSNSSGFPYPNNFVAGDNLFRDFRVDLSDAAIAMLNPADRHVQENVRDVVLLGKEGTTCLSCHGIHQQSSKKHHLVSEGAICSTCHAPGSKRIRIPYAVHSTTCGY